MSRADRRTVLRFAAATLLLPALSPSLRAAQPGSRFAPPAGPMLYTRRLVRVLHDGASFAVSRSFAIRFLREREGFRVDGQQVAVEVDAPEALAAFVRIERERQEAGLFPLLLDSDGSIAATEASPLATRLDDAVRESLAQIATLPGDATERAELVRFVNAIHQGASALVTELPRDLFAPPDTPRSETREIALPGGDAGQVTVTFRATRDPVTGLMREALREVVTVLDGDQRRTLESWTLAPLQT